MGVKLLRHNTQDILKAVQEGQLAPTPHYQSSYHRPDEDTLARYETLRHWRNKLAAERGVEPDVIISNNTLMDIARRNPKTLATLIKMGVLGNWQFETYGKALLNILKNVPQPYN